MPPTRSHTPPPPSSVTSNLMRMSTIEIPLGHHQPPDLIAHHHSIAGLPHAIIHVIHFIPLIRFVPLFHFVPLIH